MPIQPHSDAWYDRLAEMQTGYFYPWESQLEPLNGEDIYLELLEQHLGAQVDVLDIGCGHGDVALRIASRCHSVLGYDRVERYIQLAQERAVQSGLHNVAFVHADSSAEANDGRVRIPTMKNAFDLLISRRGPWHWIEDAVRVARPGAVLLQLVPENVDPPAWNAELPEQLRMGVRRVHDGGARAGIEQRLHSAGIALHSCWTFEVQEFFASPEQLYKRLAWGYAEEEVPSLAEVLPILESIFARYSTPRGVALRFGRFLWKAIVEKTV